MCLPSWDTPLSAVSRLSGVCAPLPLLIQHFRDRYMKATALRALSQNFAVRLAESVVPRS